MRGLTTLNLHREQYRTSENKQLHLIWNSTCYTVTTEDIILIELIINLHTNERPIIVSYLFFLFARDHSIISKLSFY